MDQLNTKRPDETTLPSRFQINDRVSLCIDGKVVQCKVHAIHFLPSKVKYDLDAVIAYYPVCSETPNGGEAYTRLYNVDGACVTDPLKKGYDDGTVKVPLAEAKDLLHNFFNESSDSSPFSALVQENLERLFSEFVIRKYLK